MDHFEYSQSQLGTHIHTQNRAFITSKDSLDDTKTFFQAISGEKIVQNVSTKNAQNCEVERKILEVSLKDISEKISSLPKEIQVTLEFTNQLFHAVWVENTQIQQRFRIRYEGDAGVRAEYKSDGAGGYKQEIGLNLENTVDEMLNFSQELGFQQISETVKRRTQWLLNYKNYEVRIVVDEFESLRGLTNVDPIAEIEVIVPSSQVEEAEKIIFEVGDLLGFPQEKIVKMGENRLSEIYNEKLGQKN